MWQLHMGPAFYGLIAANGAEIALTRRELSAVATGLAGSHFESNSIGRIVSSLFYREIKKIHGLLSR